MLVVPTLLLPIAPRHRPGMRQDCRFLQVHESAASRPSTQAFHHPLLLQNALPTRSPAVPVRTLS